MLPGGRFLSVFTFRESAAPDPFSGVAFQVVQLHDLLVSAAFADALDGDRVRIAADGRASVRRDLRRVLPSAACQPRSYRLLAILVRFYSVTVYLDFCRYLRPTFSLVQIAMAMSVHILLRECSQLLSVQKNDVLQQNIRLYIRQSVV